MSDVRVVRLGLVGFGAVGRAFAALVNAERMWIRADRGIELRVAGLTTSRFGAITNERGVDVEAALDRAHARKTHGAQLSAEEFARACPADVIVETMPLEPFSGALARAVVRTALTHGRSVVSANKGPVAHHLGELAALAAQNGVFYRYESAVADGMPVFSMVRHGFPAADITGFRGVLNSTSNLVLGAISAGQTLEAGVAAAQAFGVAEADPSYDLDGWDSAVKLASLSAAVWQTKLDVAAVVREPVDGSVVQRAVSAAASGQRLATIASLTRDPAGSVTGAVRLVELEPSDAFFGLAAASLALEIRSRLLCPITISSDNPTPADTAYGLLSDLLDATLNGT